MSSHDTYQEIMVEALYGELNAADQAGFDAHLASCEACATMYKGFQSTLRIMDQRVLPEVQSGYWAGYWSRLDERLTNSRGNMVIHNFIEQISAKIIPIRPQLLAVAAALMLVVTGVFIGRATAPAVAITQPAVAQATLFDEVAVAEFNSLLNSYVSKSRMLLMGFDNFDEEDDPEVFDLDHQQRIAKSVVRQGRELLNHRIALEDEHIKTMVNQIERVLLQLANSDMDDLGLTVQLVQDGMETNSIMLQLTLTIINQTPANDTENE